MAAARGRPTLVMVEPILEIAWPPQSLRKSRSRVSAPEDISQVLHGGRRFLAEAVRCGCTPRRLMPLSGVLLTAGAIDAAAERAHHLTPKGLAHFVFVGGAHGDRKSTRLNSS